ncbi:MAG: hypothetical protein ACT4NY_01130 [Pseudonocardiales bacterium]
MAQHAIRTESSFPDGAWVATASYDGTARVVVVRTEELRAVVVAHMPRPLTDAEWQRYGGRPPPLRRTHRAGAAGLLGTELPRCAR